jgi:hypothetical protein
VRRRLPLGRPAQKEGGAAASATRSEGKSGGSGVAELRNNVASLFSSGVSVGEDKPGLVVGPTLVLMGSLCFIVFVILLHIWGRVTRG